MKKILTVNGPNLCRLGKREVLIYGSETLEELCNRIKTEAENLGAVVDFFTSDIEGELCSVINSAAEKYDAIIINPGAYSHTSIALRDAITASTLPTIEVHISNIYTRETFRHTGITAAACMGLISGMGTDGYILALYKLCKFS